MKVEYTAGHKQVLDKMLLGLPGVRAGKMFGFPGYYVGPKLFACVYGQGVALKLPQSRAEELIGSRGIEPFFPLGRRMKEWVMIKRKRSGGLRQLEKLFHESVDYVAGTPSTKRRRPTKGRIRV
jgi:hypothetical protein